MNQKIKMLAIWMMLPLLALAGEPVVLNSNETAGPGDVFGMQGAGFGSNPEVWYAAVTGKEKKLQPVARLEVVSASDRNVSALMADDIRKGTLVAVWIKTGNTFSEPVFLNKARAVTLEYDEIMPGQPFRIFGRNLSLPGQAAAVRFAKEKGKGSWPAKVVKADAYTMEVIAPANIAHNTRYKVYLTNGAGGSWGESAAEEILTGRKAAADPFGLKAAWGTEFTFAQNVYNVKTDSRLPLKAKGDGLTDDRKALQQAIDIAHRQGGGVIYFPAGKYRLEIPTGSGLVMRSNIVLKGDGPGKSIIQYGFGTPPPYPDPIGKGGWSDTTTDGVAILWPLGTTLTGLCDLQLDNVNTSGKWRHSIKTMVPPVKKPGAGGSKFFAANCRFNFSVAWGLSWGYVDRMVIRDCYFDSKATITWPWLWHCNGSTNFSVRNNTVRYAAGRFGFNESYNGIIENNDITRLGDLQNPKGETGGFNIDFATDIVMMGNRMDVEGREIEYHNQGETILSQGGNPENMSMGVATAATATTLTDATKQWEQIRTETLSSSSALCIVDGKGAGQWRRIIKNNATTITVDKPWTIIPDKSSHYVVICWSAEDWLVKDNVLEGNNRGIWFYCGNTDVAIVGNRLTNSEGIYLRADQRRNMSLGRYNLSWNTLVADNKVINTNGLRPAFVCNTLALVTPDSLHGIGSLGIEIRRNFVQAHVPNSASFVRGEGYFNEVSYKKAIKGNATGILGTIFDGNIVENADIGYRLVNSIDQTVIKDPVYKNVKTPYLEAKGTVLLNDRSKQAIPVKFTLKEAGFVTLVIEQPDGKRIRNLVSETWFPAGENTAWWDGMDDLGRDVDAARHGVYHIPAKFVAPGQYRVRGLVRGEIRPFYEFSPYYTGTPPWRTQDHTGAWLANHTPPKAALFVPGDHSPTGEPSIILGAYVTEGPDGFAWIDLDGLKRGGKAWIGGHWTAAPFLAGDNGEQAVPGAHVYVASVWETSKQSGLAELRLNAMTANNAKNDYTVKEVLLHPLGPMPKHEVMGVIGGMAAHNGTVVISMIKKDRLLFIDAAKGKLADSLQVPAPRGLTFDAKGRLLVLSGKKLLRFPARHAKPEQLVTKGLEDPIAITLDREGNIYVSDRGNSHVVKIYSPGGKFLRSIGSPGAPRAGAYDPMHMNNPAGIAIDAKQQLWVTEEDYLPKRVSVWTLDGKLVNAFYGPPKYGGGGTLDAHDKKRFYYAEEGKGAMEFILDWEKGASKLNRIHYRPVAGDMQMAFRSAGPEIALYRNGQRYFTNSYNSSPTNGHSSAFLFIERDSIAYPVAAMGRAALWDRLKEDDMRSRWPAGVDLNGKPPKNEAFFIWQDLNADAQVQPAEVTMQKASVGGVSVMPDLSFGISRLNESAIRFPPVAFAESGLPRYDMAKKQVLATGVQRPASSGGDQVLVGPDGWSVLTLGIAPYSRYSFSGVKNGVPMWSYPNMWPGLHASHSAPSADRRGQLIGPTRLLGGLMPNKGSDAGPLWAVNGNHGSVYVFTADGLFVATLFVNMRDGQLWRMPKGYRNMPLDGISLGEENFWPSITQTEDGNVYIVDGARSAIVRLDGMHSVQRLPDMMLNVRNTDLERSRALFAEAEAARQQDQGVKEMTVALRQAQPVVDGRLNDWSDASWVDIDKRGVKAYFNANTRPYDLTAAAAISGNRLYVAYRTGDSALLKNSGEMPVAPFKTGGALDLMIGADGGVDPDRRKPVAGDARLLVTVVNGKPLALLYRAVVPGTREEDKIPFSSPANTITFDKVEDISSQLEFAGSEGNYEISVPVSVLGLKPANGLEIKGDIGVLRGDQGQTTSRSYWSNKATGITADVPSEAMLTPNLWGKFKFSSR